MLNSHERKRRQAEREEREGVRERETRGGKKGRIKRENTKVLKKVEKRGEGI